MIFLIFLILATQNPVTEDLNIVKNDYQNLLYYYQHPFLIENESGYIKKLENSKYIDKNSEPLYIKLLTELYSHLRNIQKTERLNKKYGVVNKFNIYKFRKTELFDDLPIKVLKKQYKPALLKNNSPASIKKGFYILETTCKFRHKHSVYLYNDLSNQTYINNKKFTGNSFIIKGKDKYFRLSLKLKNKNYGLLYIKGADCNINYKNNVNDPEINVKKNETIVNMKNEEVYLPDNKTEIEELIRKNTPMANYQLYNFYLLNDLPNEAYKYLLKWSEKCINYYSEQEKQSFFKEYIPSKMIKTQKYLSDSGNTINENNNVNYIDKLIKSDINYTPKIQNNTILKKDILVKKENGKFYEYVHYLISIKDAANFIDFFKIPTSVDILGVYSVINGKKTPLETKFTENEIFLKEIENNMILEIYLKSKIKNIIFIPERYFKIEKFSIKFDKNIKYKLINTTDYNFINKNQTQNIKPYFKMPLEANILDFLPYYAINEPLKAPPELKWYYFYKNLSGLELPDSINKITDIRKAYYFLASQKAENKALILYKWSKLKKLNTKLLIFHIKNNIYGNKLFNYPIIQYKNYFLDLNTENLTFGALPLFLKHKEYIIIDNKGAYLYKRHENILKNFVKNNKVKIDYRILENLDYAEFEINIKLNDFYTSGLRKLLKKYKNEEVIAKILELYINTRIKNTSLIDYEIKKDKKISQIKIYIKGITKTPLDYFEVGNSEFLKIKNYFYQLFTPFFNQIPELTEYIYTSEILNPIEIKMPYQEDFELNIELLDKDYEFTGENHRKIQIKDSFYLPKGIILNSEYKKFYENIKNFIYKRKNMLNNIRIIKKIKE